MQTEIFTTLLVFLSSANREIIKSTLGYIKLAIHTLPIELLRPHLKELVPALLAWSHDHKNHFKAKVRHIFERMIRRFGWNDVYQAAGEDQAAKVLVNIKKRKERAKRKRAREDDGEEEEVRFPERLSFTIADDLIQATKGKVPTGDAFEDVLYGSESELDDSDDDEQVSRPTGMAGTKRKGVEQGVRLRVDDDEPMDLLQGVASRLTSVCLLCARIYIVDLFTDVQANRRRKPGQDAGRFKTDADTGKIVINEDEESDIEVSSRKAAKDVAGSAYRESMTSVDGFTRGPNGRIKFNKDTKKRRRENEDEDGDVEMADGAATATKKNKRPMEPKLGHEFKAKVGGLLCLCSQALMLYCRELVVTSRKAAWIRMLICRCLRPRRKKAETVLALLENIDEVQRRLPKSACRFVFGSMLDCFITSAPGCRIHLSTIQCLIMRSTEKTMTPTARLLPVKNLYLQYLGYHSCHELGVRSVVPFHDILQQTYNRDFRIGKRGEYSSR
jgi:hypothetical protein